jgi:hypothetical protein
MGLLLRQNLRDLRLLRGPLCIWVAVNLVAITFFARFRGASEDARMGSTLLGPRLPAMLIAQYRHLSLARALSASGYAAILAAHWLLASLLVARAVLLDSPHGTTASWLTRPVPRGGLLTSKLLLVALAVVVPALMSGSAILLLNGISGTAIARRLPFEAVAYSGTLILVFLASALADDLGQAVLWWIAFAGLGFGLRITIRPAPSFFSPFTPETAWPLSLFAVVVPLGLVTAHQYRSRRRLRTFGLAALVVLVSHLLLDGAWLTNAAVWAPEPPEAQAVSVMVKRSTAAVASRMASSGMLLLDLGATGLPDGYDVVPVSARAKWDDRWTNAMIDMAVPDSRRRWSCPDLGSTTVVSIGPTWFRRFADQNPSRLVVPMNSRIPEKLPDMTIDVTLEVLRWRVVARLPLTPGASFDVGSSRGAIVDVNLGDTHPLVHSVARLSESGLRDVVIGHALFNAGRGELLPLLERSADAAVELPVVRDLYKRDRVLEVSSEPLDQVTDPSSDTGWLAGAELVRLEMTSLGRIHRTARLHVDAVPSY